MTCEHGYSSWAAPVPIERKLGRPKQQSSVGEQPSPPTCWPVPIQRSQDLQGASLAALIAAIVRPPRRAAPECPGNSGPSESIPSQMLQPRRRAPKFAFPFLAAPHANWNPSCNRAVPVADLHLAAAAAAAALAPLCRRGVASRPWMARLRFPNPLSAFSLGFSLPFFAPTTPTAVTFLLAPHGPPLALPCLASPRFDLPDRIPYNHRASDPLSRPALPQGRQSNHHPHRSIQDATTTTCVLGRCAKTCEAVESLLRLCCLGVGQGHLASRPSGASPANHSHHTLSAPMDKMRR